MHFELQTKVQSSCGPEMYILQIAYIYNLPFTTTKTKIQMQKNQNVCLLAM